MLFNSINYLIFFPVVFAIYWLAPKTLRPLLLLLSSYFFYMSWMPVYGILIFALTVVNYFFGIAIERFAKRAKPLLVLALITNLGTLAYFKYANFLLQSLGDLLKLAKPGTVPDITLINVILPLGISFFAFEFIHYVTDVYKGSKAISNPLHFALFAAFFPSQIAGPIKRYQDFMHQLQELPNFAGDKFREGLELLLQGLFKKVALSDNLSPLVAQGFNHASTLGTMDAWIAMLAFTLQIYFDFSGYTDMGRGSAMMLGFSLPDNFNLPYLAKSASDFWRRWHISLSSWLRDYLYIPLGGGRCSRLRKHLNLMATMLLGGLWHGAAWHFVIWGGFHGMALVINHEYDAVAERSQALKLFHQTVAGKLISGVLTFAFVVVGWVFFRAQSLAEAGNILTHLFLAQPSSLVVDLALRSTLAVSLTVYALYLLVFAKQAVLKPAFVKQVTTFLLAPPAAKAVLYLTVFVMAIAFSPTKSAPFIYFQF